jgi:hypothetical protein
MDWARFFLLGNLDSSDQDVGLLLEDFDFKTMGERDAVQCVKEALAGSQSAMECFDGALLTMGLEQPEDSAEKRVRYDAAGAFQNALRAPAPVKPLFVAEVAAALSRFPPLPIDSIGQNSLVRPHKGSDRNARASFRKVKKGKFTKQIAAKLKAKSVAVAAKAKSVAAAAKAKATAKAVSKAAAKAPPPAKPATKAKAGKKAKVALVDDKLAALHLHLRAMEIPEEALPLSMPRGLKNYTLRSSTGSVIEVHHSSRSFYIKVKQGSPLGVAVSPSVSWQKHGGVLSAWISK